VVILESFISQDISNIKMVNIDRCNEKVSAEVTAHFLIEENVSKFPEIRKRVMKAQNECYVSLDRFLSHKEKDKAVEKASEHCAEDIVLGAPMRLIATDQGYDTKYLVIGGVEDHSEYKDGTVNLYYAPKLGSIPQLAERIRELMDTFSTDYSGAKIKPYLFTVDEASTESWEAGVSWFNDILDSIPDDTKKIPENKNMLERCKSALEGSPHRFTPDIIYRCLSEEECTELEGLL
jgi:uncharacterized protein YoaH (UPF0181 family)